MERQVFLSLLCEESTARLFFVTRRRRPAIPVFQPRFKGSGSTVMILETRGNIAQTVNLALVNSGSTAQCQRAWPSPGIAADFSMSVRQYRV